MPWSPRSEPPRGLRRPVPVDPSGLLGPTPNQSRGPRWRRTSRGHFVPAAVDGSVPEQRILEASVLLPARGAVTGWAALCLFGAAYFDGRDRDGAYRPVPLVGGPGQARRTRSGVTWSQDRLDPGELRVVRGVSVTSVERALFDEMRSGWDVPAAVVALDMAAAADLTSIRRMGSYVLAHAGWGGVAVVRRAIDLADECSRSPGESRLRLAWELGAGRPRPLTNRDVFDTGGRLLGVADLIDPVAGVVGEYDGAEHARAGRRSRDASRDSAFRDVGLEVFRVTGFDEHRPGLAADRVRAAYVRAARGGRPRGWTLAAPPGWPVSRTLDEELDLADLLHDLHGRAESVPWRGGGPC